MIDILILLLYPALLWDSDKLRYRWLTPVTLVAWVMDVIICHTYWVILAGWPRDNERTVSDTLERLCYDFDHPHHKLFVAISRKLCIIFQNQHPIIITFFGKINCFGK